MNPLTNEAGRKQAAEKSQSMSQTKFTPAPWYPINYAGYWSIQPVNDYSPSDLLDSDKDKNAESNAKLMAAAPEMYNMLERILSAASEGEINWTILRDAKNLLAKARGEQTTQP